MKRFYYFLRVFVVDILVTIVAVISISITWKFAKTDDIKTLISLLTVFVTLLVIIWSRSRKRDFIFSGLTWRKDIEKWLGNGGFKYSRVNNAYEVTQADPGYIHSEALTWSDYKISFDFKIEDCLGVILRAVNLANYVMLQLTPNGIRPHIRVYGSGWLKWEANEVNLVYSLNTSSWYKCVLKCDKYNIRINIMSDGNKIFDREWIIPRQDIIYSYKHSIEHQTTHLPIPVTLEYGSVGFRNASREKAFVKNLLIEKL